MSAVLDRPAWLAGVTILQGDCIEVMRTLADASVHSVVTDPPYHLTQNSRGGHARTNNPAMPHGRHRIGDKGFMGKVWDGGDVAFRVETWAEALRVLKPGGHLLAFSSTRTYHRMVVAIEDAGFEIRDQIGWVYGSGFPKSRNLEGDWDGWGTALKPAWEPIVVARKPLHETVAANMALHHVGALNIDACRVPTDEKLVTFDRVAGDRSRENYRTGTGENRREEESAGRWPANLIHDGSDEVLAAFPDAKGQQGDLCGHSKDRLSNGIFGHMKAARDAIARVETETSAARFFYCAKASQADRNAGCDGLPLVEWADGAPNNVRGDQINTTTGRKLEVQKSRNPHPTVKPTTLMRYLVRLVTPPGGTVLDMFTGSGSTGRGAVLEGFNFIGIEREGEYIPIAKARIAAAAAEVAAIAEQAAIEASTPKTIDLFEATA